MIEVEVLSCSIANIEADTVLTGVFEDRCDLDNLSGLNGNLKDFIKELLEDGEITGKSGTATLIHSRGDFKAKRILIVGFGSSKDLSLDRFRCVAASYGRTLRDMKCRSIGIHLGFLPDDFSYKNTSMALVEGFLLGQYRFIKYRPELKKDEIAKFGIYFPEKAEYDEETICKAIKTGAIIGRATNFARDICNDPGSSMTPLKLGELACNLSLDHDLKVNILDEEQMEKLGMNLLLAVGRGSQEPSRLIVLEYRGAGKDDPVYGLMGKGVTFDSGGLSLKLKGVSFMHMDKSAGAIVIGIAVALAMLKAKVNLTVVVPAVENMPSGTAYKPGDIIEAMSGKTVEIINTDAEGRLIMADALTYMQKHLNLKNIIDVATLTGASRAALGPDIIPVFSNNKEMVRLYEDACCHSGEACWEMPLYKNYLTRLKSHVAHIKNHSAQPPVTIIAALFLAEFIEDETNWMHLDIGGHEFKENESLYLSYGANAIGMRSLIRYYLHLARENEDKAVRNGTFKG